jgi:hypothetical protein
MIKRQVEQENIFVSCISCRKAILFILFKFLSRNRDQSKKYCNGLSSLRLLFNK